MGVIKYININTGVYTCVIINTCVYIYMCVLFTSKSIVSLYRIISQWFDI